VEVLRAETPAWQSFDAPTAAEVRALVAQIIPDDDTPGAERAGVIRFIDGALAGYDSTKRDLYKTGLADTQTRRAAMFPGSASIAALTPAQQIDLLKAIEKTAFFEQLRFHAILGFFGHPMHGGNRGDVGSQLLGIQRSMAYKPPFGYYDAEASGGN
jgi:gluconate 2-dehydrogenase gamma chain